MTVSAGHPAASPLLRVLRLATVVEASEVKSLLLSFATFYSILCGYYLIRPVRDELGVSLGPGALAHLFIVVFLIMLVAVPVFGWLVATLKRRWIVPSIYIFFIANLLLFWVLLSTGDATQEKTIAAAFFVWASVFNLFVISLFWSLMADHWSSDQAKRLYGVIAAAGTCGALTGPVIAKTIARYGGTFDLLLCSALFLVFALAAAMTLAATTPEREQKGDSKPGFNTLISGALRVWESPYLFRIALFILCANLIGTYFYLEQSRIVAVALPDRAARVQFFANRDFIVSLITVTLELFVTARLMTRFGAGVPLACLPLTALCGLTALSISSSLDVIAAVMVAERSVAYGLANPAVKALYTAVSPEEKYKSQNFIDTVVYRGGDAASGWIFNGMIKSLGLGGGAALVIAVPVAVAWLATAISLGGRFKAASEQVETSKV